jgi:hypothetical protein
MAFVMPPRKHKSVYTPREALEKLTVSCVDLEQLSKLLCIFRKAI